MKIGMRFLFVSLLIGSVSFVRAQQITFLGPLSGDNSSRAFAVSNDGRVVAGESSSFWVPNNRFDGLMDLRNIWVRCPVAILRGWPPVYLPMGLW